MNNTEIVEAPKFNAVLVTRAYSCRYCRQIYYGNKHVSEEALIRGVDLRELIGKYVEKGPIEAALETFNPIFVVHGGHGNNDVTTGDSETPIWTSSDCKAMADRGGSFLSCYCGNGLGPAMIKEGALFFFGYVVAWTWLTNDVNGDPNDDWYACWFYQAHNEFSFAMLQGETVQVAYDRSQDKYQEGINFFLTDGADDKYAASAIKWLNHNMKGAVELGDTGATISSAAGVRTLIEADTKPPSRTHRSEEFFFDGWLVEYDTLNPLVGKSVKIYEIATHKLLGEVYTDYNGFWFDYVSLPDKGENGVFARYDGDEYYGPCSTPRYSIEVGFTDIIVDVEPKTKVEVDEIVYFKGRLLDRVDNKGMAGKTIEILLDGGVIKSVSTDTHGNWSFQTSFPKEGRHVLQAKFNETIDFMPSNTKTYQVAIGILPILGNIVPAGNRYFGNCSAYYVGQGSQDRSPIEAREDGIAVTLCSFGQWAQNGNGKVRGAIYKEVEGYLYLMGMTLINEYPEPITGKMMAIFSPGVEFKKGDKLKPFVHGTERSLVGYDKTVIDPSVKNNYQIDCTHENTTEFPYSFPDQKNSIFDWDIYVEYKTKEEPMQIIHERGYKGWTYTVEAPPGERHPIDVRLIQVFYEANPGEVKSVILGAICSINGRDCNLTGCKVKVLDETNNVIGESSLTDWNETNGCYVSPAFTVTASTEPGDHHLLGEFPEQVTA